MPGVGGGANATVLRWRRGAVGILRAGWIVLAMVVGEGARYAGGGGGMATLRDGSGTGSDLSRSVTMDVRMLVRSASAL